MKLIFITGAGRRLGKHLAIGFASRGCSVGVFYNQSKASAASLVKELKSLGVASNSYRVDLQSPEEIAESFRKAYFELGTPDVLVNNAGVFPRRQPLNEISVQSWDSVLDVNLRGTLLCSQAFAAVAGNGSRIINIGSVGGFEVWKGRLSYNVSKAAVIHLTKSLARELAPRISVNCVCPGAVYMPDEPLETDSELLPVAKIPMGRYATPDDVLDAVWFFANATSYITGQILSVDGGSLLL